MTPDLSARERLLRFISGETVRTIYKLPPSGRHDPLRDDIRSVLGGDCSSVVSRDARTSPDGSDAWVWVPREPDAGMHERLTALGRSLVEDAHERDQWIWFALKAYRAMTAPLAASRDGSAAREAIATEPKTISNGEAP